MTTQYDSDCNRLPGLLIVEPDPLARARLARAMEAQGWHVWSVGDGGAAVEVYQQYRARIDVALVDLQLPGLQGGLVLTELARINPDLIRCAMSADINPYAASAYRRMSDTPLFTKPLNVRALSFTLYECVIPVGRR